MRETLVSITDDEAKRVKVIGVASSGAVTGYWSFLYQK